MVNTSILNFFSFFSSQVRVDVSSRVPGKIRASYVEGPRRISDSLVLEPRQEENYYEAFLYSLPECVFAVFGWKSHTWDLFVYFLCTASLTNLLVTADSGAYLLAWTAEEPHGFDDRFHGHLRVSPAHTYGQHRYASDYLLNFELSICILGQVCTIETS